MSSDSEKPRRSWIIWLVAGIWTATAIAVFVLTRIHPATTATVSVNTKKVSFRTDAGHLLGPADQEQLLVSGVKSLSVQFNKAQTLRTSSATRPNTNAVHAVGDSFSSCTFYGVRSNGFDVLGVSTITLETVEVSKDQSFGLRVHGALSEKLSSRPSQHGLTSGVECAGVHIDGGPAEDLESTFSAEGGDSIYVATAPDARLDFTLAGHPEVRDTQIPLRNELRFSEIYPGETTEKSVLLAPADILFDRVGKKASVDSGNLLVVTPRKDLYIRQFAVGKGIQLTVHGSVRQIRAGAGPADLASLMPSAFDHMDSSMRIYGAIPALAGLLLGILEKMGILGKK